MAARTDPARLTAELLAAGVPAASFTGCRSGGPLDTICWHPGHPTAAEQALADAALAAHDPDGAAKESAANDAACAAALRVISDPQPSMAAWRVAVSELLVKKWGH